MTLIAKNHFALNRTDYIKGLTSGRYRNRWHNRLAIRQVDATESNLNKLQDILSEKWHWNEQDRYNDGSIEEKLKHPETALYELLDCGESVGYAFVTAPSDKVKTRFWKAATYPVIEIENLGLFPGNEGGGRGKAFFEMMFDQYFKNYETVYWSQHDIHSPTLKEFYMNKLGMDLLDVDHIRDFRPPHKTHNVA